MLPASLKGAMGRYIEILPTKLRPMTAPTIGNESSTGILGSPRELRDLFDQAEAGTEFSQLVAETDAAFPEGGKLLFGLREAVKNFFRRSGFYSQLYHGEDPCVPDVFDTFARAFANKWLVRKRYLAPLATAQFCAASMRFRGFEVRRFSLTELDQLLRNSVNKVFYPWAELDISKLEPYWFIDVYDQSVTSVHPEIWEHISARPSIRKEFTRFPRAIEVALRSLVLYDWEPVHKWASFQSTSDPASESGFGWFHFGIPFWLEVNENLLVQPPIPPIVPDVEIEIVGVGEDNQELEETFCAVDMDVDNEAEFVAFVSWVEERLTQLEPLQENLPFVEIAIGFLFESFFSEGLEQLLWHITVLESLVGENKRGNTSSIAARLGFALETPNRRKEAIEKAFLDLYTFRCDLVHGKKGLLQQTIYLSHLREARQLARSGVVWFLRYLEHLQSHCGDGPGMFPERRELLAVLDPKTSNSARVKQLVALLPDNFPRSFCQ